MCGVTLRNNENLVERAKTGDFKAYEALVAPLEGYKRSLCRKFFLPGAEKEDLEQEAMVGLAQAINEYEAGRGVSFQDFAMLKMRNQVVASVRKATRKKQQVLSEAAPLEPTITPCSTSSSPEEIATNRGFLCALFESLKGTLSSLEMVALLHRAEGVTVKEIASMLQLREKTVENALFRARKKAKLVSLAID